MLAGHAENCSSLTQPTLPQQATTALAAPAVAYLTRALRLSAGVVISASHNPYDDNGIKFFSGAGAKLPDSVEQAIEDVMEQPLACVPSAQLGKACRIEDARGRYIEFCKSTFPQRARPHGLTHCRRLRARCGVPRGAECVPRAGRRGRAPWCEPNGAQHQRRVGATARTPEGGRGDHGADIGIALDGDADRVMMVDATGRAYDGDQLLYVIAMDYRRRKALAGGVVGTLMTNLGLEHALAREGIALDRAAVGDRYVLERMQDRGWLLGGENSGHILCLDKHTTGDAIIAALAVLRALVERRATLAEAAAGITLFPQRLINVRVPKGYEWKANEAICAAQAGTVSALGDAGRVLLRPSGTEPVLRVMVEAREARLPTGMRRRWRT